MLNQRQIEILMKFYEEEDKFLTASFFAKQQGVSVRTVQTDITIIKEELGKTNYAVIESITPTGSCIKVLDKEKFFTYMNALCSEEVRSSLDSPGNRVNNLILMLLEQYRPVSSAVLEDELFISHSTLISDLKKVEERLSKYNLQLQKNNNRISILGTEPDKRRCLAENNLYFINSSSEKPDERYYTNENRIAYIRKVLTEEFVAAQYYIADIDLNNAILTVDLMLNRMQRGFFIQDKDIDIRDALDNEGVIAERISERLGARFFIKIPEKEIQFFALYLKGKGNYSDGVISKELDNFVVNALVHIKEVFGIDFTNNIDLRISLSLHCIPLIIRIKYNMQLKNSYANRIRKSYPLGYDVATYFAFLLGEEYNKRVVDDEISLIAVHFYNSLVERDSHSKDNKILVISSLKNSMTVLLRQTILQWFGNEIDVLDFKQPVEITEVVLDEYELFFTTEKGEYYDNGLAMFINIFPNENDRKNIKLALDGFTNIDDIMQIFQPDLFFCFENAKKEEILKQLTGECEKKYGIEQLYESVKRREHIGSSYFSKGIAVPHPIQAISSDTFIAVGVLKQEVLWDESDNKVNLIMLVHIGKNNRSSFQLWNYLAKLLAEKRMVEDILKKPTYEFFSKIVKNILGKDKY